MEQLDDERWRAVVSRDKTAGGVFVYAVRTTGIYCAPGCSSRTPLRRNVEFFATPLDASAAGYRTCRRCAPDTGSAVTPAHDAVVAVCRMLEDPGQEHDVTTMARSVGYGERHLRRLFVQATGVPIGTYLRAQQARWARAALRDGSSIDEAMVDAGYGSPRAFYEHGAPRLGMTPSRFRAGARGERIAYSCLPTPLGVVVVASTGRGVCAVRIGQDPEPLIARLREEFPLADLERDDGSLQSVASILEDALRGSGDATSLPLDVQGTAFQIRVWEALRRIERGTTQTYSEVAATIGSPSAVRAVASACAANPAALTIPCHRVVRKDGSLGGYRWGLATKRALLDAESSGSPA